MNILENYNTAKQKYGEKLVKSLSDMGIPSQYLLSACRFTTEGINPNDIKQYFRQWMTYVKRNDGRRYDVNRMSFDEFYQTIQTFKSKYGIPNKVYDDGTVSVGKITSPNDISRFPVKNEWCIKQPNQFRKYTNQGYTFYLIDNGDESDYVRYVVLMVGKDGRKYYYDLDNSEMTPNSISEFQSHLTPNAVSFIQNLNNRQETNENIKMNKKQTIRLNEAQFNRLVKESVKRVLNEISADLADRASAKAFQIGREGFGKYGRYDELPWDSTHGKKYRQAERFLKYRNDKLGINDNIGIFYPNGDDSVMVLKNYNTGEILTKPCCSIKELENEYNKYKAQQ